MDIIYYYTETSLRIDCLYNLSIFYLLKVSLYNTDSC